MKKDRFLLDVYTKIKRASTFTPAQIIPIKQNLPSHYSLSYLNKFLKKGSKGKYLPSQSIIPKPTSLGFSLEAITLTDDLTDLKPNNQPDDIFLTIKLDRCINMMENKPEALEFIKKNEARLCLFDTEKREPITAVWHVPSKYDAA